MAYPIAPPIGGVPAVGGQTPVSMPTPGSQEGAHGSAAADVSDARQRLTSPIDKHGSAAILGARTVEISFDDAANRVVVKVKSAESGEIVRQIPPEDYLKFLAKFRETIGVLFDEKA